MFIGQSHLACGMQGAFEQAWLLLKTHVVKAPLRHETVRRVNTDDDIDEYEGTFLDDKDKDNPQEYPITMVHDKRSPQSINIAFDPANRTGRLDIGSTVMPDGEVVYHPEGPETDYGGDVALETDDMKQGRGYATGMAEMLPHLLRRNPDLKFSPFLDGFTDEGQSFIDALMQKRPELFQQLMEQHMPSFLPLEFAHRAIMDDQPEGFQHMENAIKYINNAVGHDPTMRIDPDDYKRELERFQQAMGGGQ